MFEGPISNNKEKINIAPLPLGRPWHMEILTFMFDGLIYNDKENKKQLPTDTPLTKNIFFLFSLINPRKSIYIYL